MKGFTNLPLVGLLPVIVCTSCKFNSWLVVSLLERFTTQMFHDVAYIIEKPQDNVLNLWGLGFIKPIGFIQNIRLHTVENTHCHFQTERH